jgi:hypothetical protein
VFLKRLTSWLICAWWKYGLGLIIVILLGGMLVLLVFSSRSQEGCWKGCLPHQIKECSLLKSTGTCYTDKPGAFSEKAKK